MLGRDLPFRLFPECQSLRGLESRGLPRESIRISHLGGTFRGWLLTLGPFLYKLATSRAHFGVAFSLIYKL